MMPRTQALIDAIHEECGRKPRRVDTTDDADVIVYNPHVTVHVLRAAPVAFVTVELERTYSQYPMHRRPRAVAEDLEAAIELC